MLISKYFDLESLKFWISLIVQSYIYYDAKEKKTIISSMSRQPSGNKNSNSVIFKSVLSN